MKDKFQHNIGSRLDFHTVYNEDLDLKFDCVIGSNVSHKFPMHIHNSLCIGLITKGKRNMIWPDKSSIIEKHELFIINKKQPHAINQIELHDYIAITIKGDLACMCFENIINSNSCVNLFLSLFYTLRKACISELPEKWNRLYEYLIKAYKLTDSVTFDEDFIRKSLNYIHVNYQQQISVNDIAAHACMSTYHFCRLFKHLTGLAPHNYLIQYRLSQSYKHLQNNTPVFETAIATGFYDSSHFIKAFHSYMAVSPKEYQKSVRKQ